jgi:N-methylhydantoinase A/oxoprolinase/acetone carboxylase beta subunit
MPEPDLRLGVDVGRTNTDAVVMDRRDRLVGTAKVPTGGDGHAGIRAAVRDALADAGADPARVTRAMLGASHAVEALLERRGVLRVAVLRIGSPLTHAVPPLATWPTALREAVSAGEAIVRGGADFHGRAVGALDEEAIARFAAAVAARAQGVAIAGVFSPVAPDHELAAAEILRRELGAGIHLSLSHEIGSVGLLERENATVLNAALVGAAQDLAAALGEALEAQAIDAEPFFGQNDGTVMALEHALRVPVLMVGSGPASAMRGAAFLSGFEAGVVVDVGGASADVGVLVNGFPRESAPPTERWGVRVNFRTPDVVRLPLGGDGTPPDAFEERLAGAVDRAQGAVAAAPLIVVGGGGALVPDDLTGAGVVVRPADGDVAGAIGTAIGLVSGQADRICANRPDHRARAVERARAAAFERAVHAGADPERLRVVEVEEIPLTYLVDPAIQIRVKAVGPRS